jgi:hypothetical protein
MIQILHFDYERAEVVKDLGGERWLQPASEFCGLQPAVAAESRRSSLIDVNQSNFQLPVKFLDFRGIGANRQDAKYAKVG